MGSRAAVPDDVDAPEAVSERLVSRVAVPAEAEAPDAAIDRAATRAAVPADVLAPDAVSGWLTAGSAIAALPLDVLAPAAATTNCATSAAVPADVLAPDAVSGCETTPTSGVISRDESNATTSFSSISMSAAPPWSLDELNDNSTVSKSELPNVPRSTPVRSLVRRPFVANVHAGEVVPDA